jgi:hypothetical protein
MSKIHYSRGINTYDKLPEQREAVDFAAFAKAILADVGKAKGEQFICTPFSRGLHDNPEKNPGENHWRLKKLVMARRWLPLDYDGFKDAAACKQWREWLGSQYLAVVIYTTSSHTEISPRARAIVELSRPVTREESIQLGPIFEKIQQDALGVDFVKFDKSVYQSEQPCYLPVRGSKGKIFNGKPLDVDSLPQITPSTQLSTIQFCPSVNFESPRRIAIVREMLSHINADCDYPKYRDVIWAVADTGWSCAYDLLREWSLTAPHRFDEDVLVTILNSFTCSGGVHFGTLVHHARSGGWCG